MRDALTLHGKAHRSERAVVLGGGLLGLDISAALCAHALAVCTIEAQSRLLPRQLDPEGAALLAQIMADRGVEFVADDLCSRIDGRGRAERVHLKSGRVIDTDMVVVSTGIRANMQLAQSAGLLCNRGVVVNDRMQTSDPTIYAVGDVAEYHERVWGIVPAAVAQARVAAAQIAGDSDTRYTGIVPSTTLKVTGIDLTSIGIVNPQGEEDGAGPFTEVRRTDACRGLYKKLVLRGGRVVGAIVLGDRSSVRGINGLIARQTDVSSYEDRLLADDLALMALAQRA